MQQLQFKDLMQLDTATMAQVPVIRRRRLQMQYARRWLQLTRRIPRVECIPCFEIAYGSLESRKVHQQLWQVLQHKRKQSLLQTLIKQIRNMNDVAALIDAWVSAHENRWDCARKQLGEEKELMFNEATWYPEVTVLKPYMRGIRRMRQRQHKVVAALSIGFVECLDVYSNMQHPANKAAHPELAAFAACCEKGAHNQLPYLCSLHRLQQFAPEAVLARLHSIFPGCCQFDPLLLVSCLAKVRQSADGVWPGAQADDILAAFGGLSSCFKHTVYRLSTLEKVKVKQHICDKVDDWVNLQSVWSDLGRLLNVPIPSLFRWWPSPPG
ncbi:hypothetical protein ABBQ38_008208 [Trebouxia sp. C0009 RCD-2024]